MASEHEAGVPWDFVASELRACREAQQQAWGDVDNATLGRYLAGESSPEERRHVERALAELPQLRELTDLVRDVLHDHEVAPEAPAVLPFSGARRPWLARLRRRAPLVAAACLLLALGLTIPRPGAPWRASSGPNLKDGGTAEVAKPFAAPRDSLARIEHLDRAIDSLDKQGRTEEALQVARNYPVVAKEARLEHHPAYARGLTKTGQLWEKKGDLTRAAPSYLAAYDICRKSLPPTDPTARLVHRNLVEVYTTALTAPAEEPAARVWAAKGAFPATAEAVPLAANPYIPYSSKGLVLPPEAKGGVPERFAAALESHLAPPAAPEGDLALDGPLAVLAMDARPGAGRPEHTTMKKAMADRPRHHPHDRAGVSAAALRERLMRQSPRDLRLTVVPALTEALREAPTAQERATLARALGELGPAARDAVPALTRCLKLASAPEERQAVLLALGRMGPAARKAAPDLVATLASDCLVSRRYAAEALAALGPAARKDAEKKLKSEAAARGGHLWVHDEGECFTVRALHDCGRAVRGSRLEMVVETAPALGADAARRGGERLRDMGPRSVCVLVGKDDAAVRVVVSDALRKDGFPEAKLAKEVQKFFAVKQYDDGLRAGVALASAFEKGKRD